MCIYKFVGIVQLLLSGGQYPVQSRPTGRYEGPGLGLPVWYCALFSGSGRASCCGVGWGGVGWGGGVGGGVGWGGVGWGGGGCGELQM